MREIATPSVSWITTTFESKPEVAMQAFDRATQPVPGAVKRV